MFDIGLQELIVIFIVALLVFGPKRLPELGKAFGKGLGEFKRVLQDVKEQVETDIDEARKSMDSGTEDDKESARDDKKNDKHRAPDDKPI